jgi:hypothetical protein
MRQVGRVMRCKEATMQGRIWVRVALFFGVLGAAAPSMAADPALEPFFGEYVGRSIQAPNEPLSPRDLGIKISRRGDNGFTLTWTTVIHDAAGARRQSYSVRFVPSARDGIFSSAMRHDMFGHTEPLDPLRGEPYVWADIHGPTLRVHALLIVDDGGYEIQVYQRTLTDDGMTLQFSRNRNGRELKTISGTLTRKAG